jgi:Ca2+-binding EF-hand superfamily protein
MKSLLLVCIAALAATLPLACSSQQQTAPVTVYSQVDSSRDGRISVEEFCEAYFTMAFTAIDTDVDGRVTLREWALIETEDQDAVIFLQLDEDGNGSLTYIEFSSPADRRETIANMFGTLDTDGDGVLLEEELTQVEES